MKEITGIVTLSARSRQIEFQRRSHGRHLPSHGEFTIRGSLPRRRTKARQDTDTDERVHSTEVEPHADGSLHRPTNPVRRSGAPTQASLRSLRKLGCVRRTRKP